MSRWDDMRITLTASAVSGDEALRVVVPPSPPPRKSQLPVHARRVRAAT